MKKKTKEQVLCDCGNVARFKYGPDDECERCRRLRIEQEKGWAIFDDSLKEEAWRRMEDGESL